MHRLSRVAAGARHGSDEGCGRRTNRHGTLEPAAKQEEPDHADGAAARGRSVPAEGTGAPTETLRVDIEQLDELMNLSGQLVISKARFAQFGDRLKTLRASKRWMQAMTRLLAGLGRLGDEDEGDRERQSPAAELQTLRRQARRFHNELGRRLRGNEGPGKGPRLDQRSLRGHSPARPRQRCRPAGGHGYAHGAHRAALHALQAGHPRHHAGQRERGPPGDQRREDQAGQADDRRAGRSADPHGPQLRPITASSCPTCARRPESRARERSPSTRSTAAITW